MIELIIKEGIETVDGNIIGKVTEGEKYKLILPKSIKKVNYSSFSETFIELIEYKGTLNDWDKKVEIIGDLTEIPIKCLDKAVIYR